MKISLIFLGLLSGFFFVCSTPMSKCLNAPMPYDIRISNCTALPCSFIRGETMDMEIDFLARQDTNHLTAKALALALGVETSYPLPTADVCKYLINGECPLDAGEVVTYRASMPILPSFPKVHVVVKLYLESEHGVDYCMQFSGDVV